VTFRDIPLGRVLAAYLISDVKTPLRLTVEQTWKDRMLNFEVELVSKTLLSVSS